MCRGRLVLHSGQDDDRDGASSGTSQSSASVSIPTAPPTKNSWPSRTKGAMYRSNKTSQRSAAAGGMARGPVMVIFMALHCRGRVASTRAALTASVPHRRTQAEPVARRAVASWLVMDDPDNAALHAYYALGRERDRLAEARGMIEFERTKEIVLRHLPTPTAVTLISAVARAGTLHAVAGRARPSRGAPRPGAAPCRPAPSRHRQPPPRQHRGGRRPRIGPRRRRRRRRAAPGAARPSCSERGPAARAPRGIASRSAPVARCLWPPSRGGRRGWMASCGHACTSRTR
jgi:hypothetical protein